MKKKTKWVLALVWLSAIFASMWIFGRYLATDLELFQQVYLRIGLATLLAILVFYRSINFSNYIKIPKKELLLLFGRGSLNYLAVVVFTYAILHTNLANVSFVVLFPTIALFSIIFLWEKVNISKGIVLILSMLWVLFIGKESFSYSLWSWEIAAIICDVLFAIVYLSRGLHSKILSNKEITVWMLFSGFIFTFVVSMLLWEQLSFWDNILDKGLILMLFWSATFNIINMLLMNYGFAKVKWILADRILTLEVLFALLLWFIFYSERPSSVEIIWMLLIVGSVLYLQKVEYKEEKDKKVTKKI